MKSIGIFNSQNIPISTDEYGTLLVYTKDDREIRIYYRKEEPFYQVAYVAILLERTLTFETFDVFEYEYYNPNDKDVKSYIRALVETSEEYEKLKKQSHKWLLIFMVSLYQLLYYCHYYLTILDNFYIIAFAYVYAKPRQMPVGAFKEDTGEKAPRLAKKQKNIGQLADLPKLAP